MTRSQTSRISGGEAAKPVKRKAHARMYCWRGRAAELLASANPFALVVLAQLKILELRQRKGDDLMKYAAKRGLIRLAYQRGYERKYIESLLRFIDWIMCRFG